jgi:phage gp29-like protein
MILDQYGDPIKIDKRSLTTEMAEWSTATGTSYDILPDPDPILKKRGDDATVLDALAADDQVTMAMQLRKRRVTNKGDYDYAPGQPEKGKTASKNAVQLSLDLTHDLASIKLKNQFNAILAANFYGYSVIELYWGVDGGRYKLVHMEEKPRSWFTFSGRGELLFLENGREKPVPYGKFLVARHEPTYENPFGLRLLSRCLWPVAFKRSGVEWCMKFLERYGIPWQVAKAPSNFDDAGRKSLATSLAAMVQDAVAVLPAGAEHSIVTVDAKGGADTFMNFMNFWNAAISKVLSCQTQSSEITGSTGTYASSQTHYEVLGDVAEADELLVCDAMNDLAVIYARVNGSQEYPPVFSFTEAEDHMAQADLDKKRWDVGVRFTKPHFERQGLEPDEFELAPEPAPFPAGGQAPDFSGTGQAGAGTQEFAAGKPFTEEQQALEDLADDSLGRVADGVGKFQAELISAVEAADSFDDLILQLEQAFPESTLGQFEDILAQAMTAANMFGRYQIIQEAK